MTLITVSKLVIVFINIVLEVAQTTVISSSAMTTDVRYCANGGTLMTNGSCECLPYFDGET